MALAGPVQFVRKWALDRCLFNFSGTPVKLPKERV
jgi:hypothetical protein